MKFFVDTADVGEIRELAATGLLDGVTTNPTLIAKAGRPIKRGHRRDLRGRARPGLGRGAATDFDGMMAEGARCSPPSPRTSPSRCR